MHPGRLDLTHHGVAALSLTALTDHIVAEHHTLMRRELDRAAAAIPTAQQESSQHTPLLQSIHEILLPLRAEIEDHLLKEEQVVFPLIRELDFARTHPGRYSGGMTGGIAELQHDHDLTTRTLAALRSLTGNFNPPPGAGPALREIFAALRAIDDDLPIHTQEEDELLLPRARQLELQLARSVIPEAIEPPD